MSKGSPDTAHLRPPLSSADVEGLRTGDLVSISGAIYTARDAAHKRMWEAVQKGNELPFDPHGQIIYYVGPTPAKPGQVIGSAGPTTASRMDPYTPFLIKRGLKGMIGKGQRCREVRQAMRKHQCVYLGAVEGTAALIAECVETVEVIAYEDLGTEALRRLAVKNLPTIIVNDVYGGDLYEEGRREYQRSKGNGNPHQEE